MDDKLKQAYLAAEYIVDDDPPLVLKIGERNDGLRVLFASFNVESAAFITAWNPKGEKRDVDDNYDRQAELLSMIEQMRLNYFPGRGEDPAGDWYEESFLVLGVTQEQALMLAAHFDQNAIVWISMSGVPELIGMQS